MSTDVVTVDTGSTLAEAVEELLAHGVGSVVVLDDGVPSGIVTESDALRAALESGEPLSAIATADLAHQPIITASPDETVRHVADRMADNGVKKVPVTEGIDLVGIVTLTDVVWHLSDIRKEASAVDAARKHWDSQE